MTLTQPQVKLTVRRQMKTKKTSFRKRVLAQRVPKVVVEPQPEQPQQAPVLEVEQERLQHHHQDPRKQDFRKSGL